MLQLEELVLVTQAVPFQYWPLVQVVELEVVDEEELHPEDGVLEQEYNVPLAVR
ncbi:MAG: hypothetical protein AAB476_00990 [Patescibacteria group bacterium]